MLCLYYTTISNPGFKAKIFLCRSHLEIGINIFMPECHDSKSWSAAVILDHDFKSWLVVLDVVLLLCLDAMCHSHSIVFFLLIGGFVTILLC